MSASNMSPSMNFTESAHPRLVRVLAGLRTSAGRCRCPVPRVPNCLAAVITMRPSPRAQVVEHVALLHLRDLQHLGRRPSPGWARRERRAPRRGRRLGARRDDRGQGAGRGTFGEWKTCQSSPLGRGDGGSSTGRGRGRRPPPRRRRRGAGPGVGEAGVEQIGARRGEHQRRDGIEGHREWPRHLRLPAAQHEQRDAGEDEEQPEHRARCTPPWSRSPRAWTAEEDQREGQRALDEDRVARRPRPAMPAAEKGERRGSPARGRRRCARP